MNITVDADMRARLSRFQNGQTILNEAIFGYRHIKPYLDSLAPGSEILEIGSGPCILLSQICTNHPALHVRGIEPLGPGFDTFRDVIRELKSAYGFFLHEGGYEDYEEHREFDFIFSVNVFEHLPDWRHHLQFVRSRLRPDGKCVVLCPNYGFPYESHFRLPIVHNKALTHSIFRKRIAKFEELNNCEGLWASLNFVTLRQISREAPKAQLQLKIHTKILDELIDRLEADKEFYNRQKTLGAFAILLKRCGATRLLSSNLLRGAQPYMFLEFSRGGL